MSELVGIKNTPQIGEVLMKDGTPVIYDGLQKTDFALFCPRIPNVLFSLQNVSLPSIKVNEVAQPSRYVDMNEIGEKVVYDPYTVNFVVDKYLRNYVEAFNWIKRMTVAGSSVGETDDAILFINGKETFRFVGCWPTNLGGIELDSTDAEGDVVISSLTLNYDYLDYIGDYATTDSSYN